MKLGNLGRYSKIEEEFLVEWHTKEIGAEECGEDPYRRRTVDLWWCEVGQVPHENQLEIKERDKCNCHKGVPWENSMRDYVYPRMSVGDPTLFAVPSWWYDEMEDPSDELLEKFELERGSREHHIDKIQTELDRCTRWCYHAPRQAREA